MSDDLTARCRAALLDACNFFKSRRHGATIVAVPIDDAAAALARSLRHAEKCPCASNTSEFFEAALAAIRERTPTGGRTV